MKNFSKNIILWIVIGLLLIALFNLFQNSSSTNSNSEISFSDFLIAADNGNISEVKIAIYKAILTLKLGSSKEG